MVNLVFIVKQIYCITIFSISGALAFGVKESSKVNNVFTLLNVAMVAFVIIAGAIKGMFKMLSVKVMLK